MKLHNLVLTAALFLTAGIASAEVFENNGNIGWNNSSHDNTVTINVTYYGQDGFSFAAYDTAKYSSLSSFSFQDLEKNPSKYEGSAWLLKSGSNTLTLSESVQSLGFIGTNGKSAQHLVYSANGSEVDTVMVDGKVLMKGKKLLTIDENQVYEACKEIVKRLHLESKTSL